LKKNTDATDARANGLIAVATSTSAAVVAQILFDFDQSGTAQCQARRSVATLLGATTRPQMRGHEYLQRAVVAMH
jgi:hypothetical protein